MGFGSIMMQVWEEQGKLACEIGAQDEVPPGVATKHGRSARPSLVAQDLRVIARS